jgi:hypothetical protein
MQPNELDNLKVMVGSVMSENLALKERVSLLEKRTKVRAVSLVTIAIVLFINIYLLQSKQTFSGRWMAVNDRNGHISAWLDDTGLQFKDQQGRVRAKLGLFPGGDPFLQMFSEDGVMRAQLFIYPPDKAGYLMLWGKDGKGVRYPPSTVPEK